MKFTKFWIYAITPLAAVLIAAFLAWDFVWHAITNNTVLNSLIILTALFTAFLNLRVLKKVHNEFNVVKKFEESPTDIEVLLDENDQTLRKILVAEMLHYVVKLKGRVKTRFDQAKIEQEYEFVRESLEAQLGLPSYLAGLMVGLGLFGTFIGLLVTLVAVGDLIGGFSSASAGGDDIISSLVSGLQRPIASMGIAFSSSLFGLTGSIVLGFVTLAVRAANGAVIDELRFTLAGVVSLGRSKRVGQSGKSDDQGFAPSIFGEIGATGAMIAAPTAGGFEPSQLDAMSSEFMPMPDESMPADLGPLMPGAYGGTMADQTPQVAGGAAISPELSEKFERLIQTMEGLNNRIESQESAIERVSTLIEQERMGDRFDRFSTGLSSALKAIHEQGKEGFEGIIAAVRESSMTGSDAVLENMVGELKSIHDEQMTNSADTRQALATTMELQVRIKEQLWEISTRLYLLGPQRASVSDPQSQEMASIIETLKQSQHNTQWALDKLGYALADVRSADEQSPEPVTEEAEPVFFDEPTDVDLGMGEDPITHFPEHVDEDGNEIDVDVRNLEKN